MKPLLIRLLAVVLAAAALMTALGIGWLVVQRPDLGLAAAASVLALGVAVAHPSLLPVLAMPLLVVVARFGGEGVDLTLSDLVLALAVWPALLLGPRPMSDDMRRLLWLNGIYQALTLLTVVANPFLANTVEWFHAWLLVSGALVVGWTAGRSGRAKPAMTLFLLACLSIALTTIATGLMRFAAGNFEPVYLDWPWWMHKNFIGPVLAFAAVAAYAHPSWMGWSRRWALTAFWILGVAIVMTQSRQALVALGVVLLILTLRGGERRRSRLVLVVVAPVLLFVGTMVRDQVQSGNQFNSYFQRLDWYTESWAIWLESPWVGHGLRYWYGPDAPGAFQPPNVVLEVLATAGVVGLAGFLVMALGTLHVLWRLEPAFGSLAFAMVLSRLVQGQFDLFWVAVLVSVPFALAGLALGARDYAAAPPAPGRLKSDVRHLVEVR